MKLKFKARIKCDKTWPRKRKKQTNKQVINNTPNLSTIKNS